MKTEETQASPDVNQRLSRRLALGALVGSAATAAAVTLSATPANAATILASAPTYTDLAALPITSPMEPVIVLGRSSVSDGGEGVFVWDSAGSASDADSGTRIASTTSASGLWRRQMGGTDSLSARWFGVTADGTTDDTAAFQSAVNAAVGWDRALAAPTGTILITDVITLPSAGSSRRFVLLGGGPNESQFMLSGSGRFDLNLGVSTEWETGHLILRDLSIRCDSAETVTAITATFARTSGATAQTSIIENIEITGASDSTGPKVGIHLVDANALRFRGARIQGRRTPGPGANTAGVLLSGGSIPVEIYLSEINVFFLNTAFLIDGESDRRLEGVHFDKCAAVVCDYGIVATALPTDQSLWIKVSNSHFNCVRGGIVTRNYGNILLTGNLLYGLPNLTGTANYVALDLSNGGGATVGSLSVISDNIILYVGTTTAAKNGIVISGAAAEDTILISNNVLGFFNTAIWLSPTAEKVAVAGTNMFRGNTTNTLDQGTNNVVAPPLAAW